VLQAAPFARLNVKNCSCLTLLLLWLLLLPLLLYVGAVGFGHRVIAAHTLNVFIAI